MRCTPEEAKTKWCPMARCLTKPYPGTFNRNDSGGGHIEARCLGPTCMWWADGEDGKGCCEAAPTPEVIYVAKDIDAVVYETAD